MIASKCADAEKLSFRFLFVVCGQPARPARGGASTHPSPRGRSSAYATGTPCRGFVLDALDLVALFWTRCLFCGSTQFVYGRAWGTRRQANSLLQAGTIRRNHHPPPPPTERIAYDGWSQNPLNSRVGGGASIWEGTPTPMRDQQSELFSLQSADRHHHALFRWNPCTCC